MKVFGIHLTRVAPWRIAPQLLAVMALLFGPCGLGGAATVPVEPAGSQFPKGIWAPFVEADFPFFSSVLDGRKLGDGLPENNLSARCLILNLGAGCWAAFDTDLLRVVAIWKGRGVTLVSMSQISYNDQDGKAPPGEEILPRIDGTAWMATGLFAGWQASEAFSTADPRPPLADLRETGRGALPPGMGRFRALRFREKGVCLDYEVAGIPIREALEAREVGGAVAVQRSFYVERHVQKLWLGLGKVAASRIANLNIRIVGQSNGFAEGAVRLADDVDGCKIVSVQPSEQPQEFTVSISTAGGIAPWKSELISLQGTNPAPARWPQSVLTRGTLASPSAPFVVDPVALPTANPWKRNVRFADIAFFHDGRAACVTFDGDVWMVRGLHGDLTGVEWRRFASGLHEPLSIGIRNEELFVFDRNGIWRLRDTDGNGEADVHELYSNAFSQTAETREYAQGMKIAPDGSFILAKGGIQNSALGGHNGMVLRVTPDGRDVEVLGRGFRSPFVGVHPETGLVTASDQQGNYVPTTPIHVVQGNRFYGFLSNLLPAEHYPAPITEPMVWIPYPVNASGAGQVWLAGARMGGLSGSLIHLGYYRPELFVVRTRERGTGLEAAVVSVTRNFDFAPLNAAVNPRDGKLYVIGLQIWGSQARAISGLARVRDSSFVNTLPRQVTAFNEGVLIEFDQELDRGAALDLSHYSFERWNYRRSASYGSPHYKLDGSKGTESLAPSSTYLGSDRRRVFVGIPGMKPSMQFRVGWSISTKSGVSLADNAYLTPRNLPHFLPASEGFEPLVVDLSPREVKEAPDVPPSPGEGLRLAGLMGCTACHSADGTLLGKAGPTWKGLYESEVPLANGAQVRADDAYLRESIVSPAAKIVKGYEKTDTAMPSYEGILTASQVEALISYIRSLR